MQSTALILRPKHVPEIRVLECDGPEHFTGIYLYPGAFAPGILSFEQYMALPDHSKESRERSGSMIEFESAQRVIRLLDQLTGNTPQAHRQLREIRWRVITLQPGCDKQF